MIPPGVLKREEGTNRDGAGSCRERILTGICCSASCRLDFGCRVVGKETAMVTMGAGVGATKWAAHSEERAPCSASAAFLQLRGFQLCLRARRRFYRAEVSAVGNPCLSGIKLRVRFLLVSQSPAPAAGKRKTFAGGGGKRNLFPCQYSRTKQ